MPASRTALVRYDERQIELVQLVGEPDPGLVELCPEHAARLTPPLGWTIAGSRVPQSVSA